jgi:hypothetical protein
MSQIALVQHCGVMATHNGIYTVDHENKVVTLTVEPPWFEQWQHDRHVKAFKKIGYG